MRNVLAIFSSLSQQDGNSAKLTSQYLSQLQKNTDVNLTTRDLYTQEGGHLTKDEMEAWMTEPASRSERQTELAAISDALIEEVKAADEIVLGVPMYNFGIPSALKVWIDRVARAGVTFRYTDNGPEGLLENKPVTVLAARGGQYQGTEMDTQTPYLKHFFNFLGITNVRFVYAEGLAMGEQAASESFSRANEKIVELTRTSVD